MGNLLEVEEPVVSGVWVVSEQDWAHFQKLTAQVEGIAVSTATTPWSPGTVFANLTRTGTSKASALCWLARHHSLEAREVAMIGVGENDLGAMEAAGLSIAVGNAPETVKARVQVVVGEVDAGGLAEAISTTGHRAHRGGARGRATGVLAAAGREHLGHHHVQLYSLRMAADQGSPRGPDGKVPLSKIP